MNIIRGPGHPDKSMYKWIETRNAGYDHCERPCYDRVVNLRVRGNDLPQVGRKLIILINPYISLVAKVPVYSRNKHHALRFIIIHAIRKV